MSHTDTLPQVTEYVPRHLLPDLDQIPGTGVPGTYASSRLMVPGDLVFADEPTVARSYTGLNLRALVRRVLR